MKAFAHDVFTYPLPPGHHFPLGKYRLVRQGAEASPAIQVADASAATEDELALAHEPGFLERVSATGLTRREECALGLPWSPALVERARRSVGATLLAADAALADGIGANLGGAPTTPSRGAPTASPAPEPTSPQSAAASCSILPGRCAASSRMRTIRSGAFPATWRSTSRTARPTSGTSTASPVSSRKHSPARPARPLLLPRRRRPLRGRPARAARAHAGRPGGARRARARRTRARGRARVPDPRRRLRRPDRGHGRHQPEDVGDIRVAVVTGGSSGIGAAVARLLAGRGWRCVLLARGLERLEAVASEIDGEAEPCDVGDRTQVEEAARRVAARHPAAHLLINNAGIPGRGSFLDVEPERIEAVIRTNYLGSVWCTRAFLPLLEAAAPADVVNVVSVAGLVAHGASGPYSAAKHAQLAFSRAVGPELRQRGVRVHAVCPGPVETAAFPQGNLLERPLAGRTVLQPQQVAEAVLAAVEHDRAEVVLPRYLRLAGVAQALLPVTVGRFASRLRGRS